jgi:hypothetical protein
MTMQPFKIQSPTLSLNGVNIDTSAQGKLVIPGVTRAGTSVAIEVNDTGDQTIAYTQLNGDATLLTIIDGYQFAVLNGDVVSPIVGWTAATYAADALDGEGFIDGISVVTGGAGYTGEAVTYSHQMLATTYADPINNFNPGDWDWIPFSVRCGAGEIESEFGGGGSGDRLTSPNGDHELVLDNNGTVGIVGGTIEAIVSLGGGYVTSIDGDGVNFIWNGEDTGNIGKGPGGFSLNANSGKSVYISTDGGNNNWEFSASAGLVFPDNTTQTTAYTGQSGSSAGELYIFVNADGTVITSTDGITWGQPQASGVPGCGNDTGPGTQGGIGKAEVHGGVIVYTRSDIGLDTITPQTGMYYSTVIGTATLCAGTDSFFGDDLFWNEVHYFNATARWVAVGFAQGTTMYPVVAHSLNGISWTVVPANGAFLSGYLDGYSAQFTDVVYNAVSSQYVISAIRTTQGPAYGGMFVTSDITTAIDGTNWVDVNINGWRLAYFPQVFWGGETGLIFVVNQKDDGTFGLWEATPTFVNPTDLLDPGNWQAEYGGGTTNGWLEGALFDNLGYVPDISEIAYNNNVFIVTTMDGQVFVQPDAPATYVTIPNPYTASINDIVRNASGDGLPTTITFTVVTGNGPAADGEKIIISGVTSQPEGGTTEQSYNGTYYIKNNNGSYELYRNPELTQPWDTSTYWPVNTDTGTLTWSHGTWLDAAGVSGDFVFVGNDDEQVFRSADFGLTWTQEQDVTGRYFNDFAYGTFGSGGSLNELVNGAHTVVLDADGNLNLEDGAHSGQYGRIQTRDGYPTLMAYGTGGEHGGPELDWMDSDNPTADFNSSNTIRHTMFINGQDGLYIGMNENQKPGVFSGSWNFNTDGSLSLPQESIVGGFVNQSGNGSWNEWATAGVTGPDGTVYVVGGESNINQSFVTAVNKTGTTLWRKSINTMDVGDGSGNNNPQEMNIKFDVAHNLLYAGFDFGNSTGVFSLIPATGVVDSSWVIRGGTDGNQTISQKSFTVDAVGDPIIAGHSFGAYNTRNGLTATKGTDGNGNDYISVALSDITSDVASMNNNWDVDIDGTGNWYDSDFNTYYGVPAVYNGTPGVGGLQLSTEGTEYSAGAVTGYDGYGIDIDASMWTDQTKLGNVLAQTNGVHFTVVIGSLTPGVDQTVYTFSSVSDWSVPTGTVYHMDGNWTLVSGTGTITSSTDIMSITYGSVVKLNLYTYIDRNNGSIYEDGNNIFDYGTNYQAGDTLKIPGSLLGGRDGGWIMSAQPNGSNSNGDVLFFSIASYPTLDVDVPAGTLFRYQGPNNLNQTVVSVVDNNAGDWYVTITGGRSDQNTVDFFAGNDYQFTWQGSYISSSQWLPAEAVRLSVNQTIATQSTYNVRSPEGQQAFVWTPNWSHTYGSTNYDEYFNDVAYDAVNDRVLVTGYFQQNGSNSELLVMSLDNANSGATIWQKFVGDNNTGNYGYSSSIDVDSSGNVFTIGTNDNGQAMITKQNGLDGSITWQSVQTDHNNWNYDPQGRVDANGDVYFGRVYYDNNVNYTVLGLTKLNGGNGTLAWSRRITNIQGYWMYDGWDTFQQAISIGDGQIQWSGYVSDINNDYIDAITVSLPLDGSGVGTYGRWIVEDDTNTTILSGNDSYQITPPVPYVATDAITFTLSSPTINVSDVSAAVITRDNIELGGGSIVFADGSDITQAGISRALTDKGDNTTYLNFEHNGKFIYFNGNQGSSTVRVPQNFDTALPIGFTVTLVIDDFDYSSVYVNTSNDTSNGLHISAVGFSQGYSNNNWWRLGSDNNTGIYTLMKVDTNRWVLSGPSVLDDY